MNELKTFKSFTNAHSGTLTLIGTSILKRCYFKGCKVSVYQARLEVQEYFSLIREWNRRQVDPHVEELDPEPLLLKEMTIL